VPASLTTRLQPGGKLDRFRLERQLGSGSFGEVWLALDEGGHGFRKKVALKVLGDTRDPRRVEALLREARICGALNHPNVVDVYGVMQVEGVAFIIMEFVEGETLSSLWRDLEFLGLRVPRSVILDIGIAVAEALHHAWTAQDADGKPLGIVHRDLKPANVMISDRGTVKVGDFGIAKVADDTTGTRTGKLKGTPSYMAPELWSGTREFKPSIDLWSLGVILWELTAGKRFLASVGIADIFDTIRRRTPAHEASQISEYFPELAPLVERLLQREQMDRPQHGLEVAERLRVIRHSVGAPGDLLQFIRLVRAGRLEPADRTGSLAALPALPGEAVDWQPLVAVARGEGAEPVPWDFTDPKQAPVRLGPVAGTHSDAPSAEDPTATALHPDSQPRVPAIGPAPVPAPAAAHVLPPAAEPPPLAMPAAPAAAAAAAATAAPGAKAPMPPGARRVSVPARPVPSPRASGEPTPAVDLSEPGSLDGLSGPTRFGAQGLVFGGVAILVVAALILLLRSSGCG
jgi:serine/threonine-protein kinase